MFLLSTQHCSYYIVRANRAALVNRNAAEYHDVEIGEVDSGDNIVAPAEKNFKDSAVVVNMLNDATTSAASNSNTDPT